MFVKEFNLDLLEQVAVKFFQATVPILFLQIVAIEMILTVLVVLVATWICRRWNHSRR